MRPEAEPHGLLQEGNVLADQLLLQGDGAGADHRPAAARAERQRDQVGEALPGAGTCLHQGVPLLLQSPLHQQCHLDLLLSYLVIRYLLRERLPEYLLNGC